jgi:all-trans-8'-apo-beta-carotenal 15,15'-oxygenase
VILLVARDGRSPPRLVETEPFFQFHFANGFEQDGAVVLDLARYPDYGTIGQALRDYWRSPWPAAGMACLTRLRLDLASGHVAAQTFDVGTANEFPRIDPRRVGRRHRYAYLACNAADRTHGLQQQLVRVDLEQGTVVRRDFGPSGYVGEPVFIPTGEAEDDGVVVALVFDAVTQRSAVVGLDARDLAARPLFVGRLRHHVPFSLHGWFAAAGGLR